MTLRQEKAAIIADAKQGPCECCGKSWPAGMDLAHKDKDQKIANVSGMNGGGGSHQSTVKHMTFPDGRPVGDATVKEVEEEIEKCYRLCKSCHFCRDKGIKCHPQAILDDLATCTPS